jgi:hypothetical protein
MTDPIVDSDGSYWTVYGTFGDGDDVCIGIRENEYGDVEPLPPFVSHDYGGSHHDGDMLSIFDRANAARLLAALMTALTGNPVPPIGVGELGETGEWLEIQDHPGTPEPC